MILSPASSADRHSPWVSFCIATFRRPEYLARALQNILGQSFRDFEVIVSDNDPEKSSAPIVDAAGDSRVRYRSNVQNVGMVKNFNAALGAARGKYVVMITDDDPIGPDMLSTLRSLEAAYPGYGAYYGACDVSMDSREMAATYQTVVGKRSCASSQHPIGSVRIFEPRTFVDAFLRREIFPYILWSTGIVRRDIALSIGGMPDYGSAYLTDFTYVLLAGQAQGFVALNRVLGFQSVHGNNSGFTDPHRLVDALNGCKQYLRERLGRVENWKKVEPLVDRFAGVYLLGHCRAMRKYYAEVRKDPVRRTEAQKSLEWVLSLPTMRSLRVRHYALELVDRIPYCRSLVRLIRNVGAALREWRRRDSGRGAV
jgi:glycosyltransferase involved in cell wall biosynthesis